MKIHTTGADIKDPEKRAGQPEKGLTAPAEIKAWLNGAGGDFRPALAAHMRRLALAETGTEIAKEITETGAPRKKAWDFLWNLRPGPPADLEAESRWRELFDQALEYFIEARLKLAALGLEAEKRQLGVFLRRAGHLTEEEEAGISRPPVCRPHNDKSSD